MKIRFCFRILNIYKSRLNEHFKSNHFKDNNNIKHYKNYHQRKKQTKLLVIKRLFKCFKNFNTHKKSNNIYFIFISLSR